MSLRVWLGDQYVGTLNADDRGWIVFEPTKDYWELDPRPVVAQALEHSRGKDVCRSRHALPPMFSNLLPEGELRTRIAEHHDIDPRREFRLLQRLGEDLPGALCFTDGDGVGPVVQPSPVPETDAWAFSSLAGVQPKFTTERTGKGLVLAAKGRGERWMVKVPDGRFEGIAELEDLVTRWARHVGITTVESTLVSRSEILGLPAGSPVRDAMCFASKRYDRQRQGRVHQAS